MRCLGPTTSYLTAACGVQQNNTSKAVEYKGKVAELVKGMLDVPHGGQIIMDGRAFQGIKAELTTLAAMTPPHPDYDAIERQRRCLLVMWTCMHVWGLGLAGICTSGGTADRAHLMLACAKAAAGWRQSQTSSGPAQHLVVRGAAMLLCVPQPAYFVWGMPQGLWSPRVMLNMAC